MRIEVEYRKRPESAGAREATLRIRKKHSVQCGPGWGAYFRKIVL
jgi:hypothetical protein